MYSIDVKNIKTDRHYGGRFKTTDEAMAWHRKHIETHGDEALHPPTAVVTIRNIDASVLVDNKNSLLENYTQVEAANLAPIAAAKILAWANAGNKKAKEVLAWSDALWAEYKVKKDQLVDNTTVDLMPSANLLVKPYTFEVVQAEVLKTK